jgi:hypothetical protein
LEAIKIPRPKNNSNSEKDKSQNIENTNIDENNGLLAKVASKIIEENQLEYNKSSDNNSNFISFLVAFLLVIFLLFLIL